MWYLIIQILVLMIFAAVAGAALAYWWMRNRYEDVTESYEDMLERSTHDALPPPATRADLQAFVSGLEARLESRLEALPALVTREELDTGLRGIGAQIASIPQPEKPEQPDLTPITTHLETVSHRLEGITGNVEGMRAHLTAEGEESAFTPLMDRLSQIEVAVGELKNTELNTVEGHLESLDARISRIEDGVNLLMSVELPKPPEIPEVDLGPVHSALASIQLAIESIDVPITDLDPIRQDFGQMESRLAEFAEGLDAQRKADNESMTIRLQTLSSSLASLRVPDVDGLRERLSKLENVITALSEQKSDLGPITETLREIDKQMRNPSDDMRKMSTRLADLEGGTAAVHAKLVLLENTVSGMRPEPVDLSPVQIRIAHLETAISSLRGELQSLPDVTPLERRIAGLQESVLSLREPDLSGLTNSLRKMEARMNLGAVEDRLNAIEYALSSLTHFVRTRPDPVDYSFRTPAAMPVYDEQSGPTFTLPEKKTPASPPSPPPPPAKPPAPEVTTGDPVEAAMRPDDKANLLVEAAFGEGDDLELINGVGPMLCELLNDIGVYYFWQVAEWGEDEIEWVDGKLEHFKGRIERDDWVGQARLLAQRPDVAKRPRPHAE
ncbi:hypothetical protein [Hyphomonas pacifica]|uniref:hypothetical protein n=1 Tax=Hyphomonas pacifica TaxID=1280941 RepID=UPI000DC02718|nr:hypothetical protein [Hyphomonas pacifica]RAN35891.1 hypothetical protein HY11_12980 [Hyphomonas pacifica]